MIDEFDVKTGCGKCEAKLLIIQKSISPHVYVERRMGVCISITLLLSHCLLIGSIVLLSIVVPDDFPDFEKTFEIHCDTLALSGDVGNNVSDLHVSGGGDMR